MSAKRRLSEVCYQEMLLARGGGGGDSEEERSSSKKKKRGEVDRRAFTKRYCRERSFGSWGEVEAERECYRLAAEARDEFKALRTLVEGGGGRGRGRGEPPLSRADLVGVSPSQKYERRLHNNRRSAAVSKVYYEVLDHEKSHTIRRLSARVAQLEADARRAKQHGQEYSARLDDLHDQNRKLREENTQLKVEKDRVTSSVVSKSFASRSSSSQPKCASDTDPFDTNQFFNHSQEYASSQGIEGY